MRGFRASRAAQNQKSSRFKNGNTAPTDKHSQFDAINQRQGVSHDQHAVTKLPEWLRMPQEVKLKVLHMRTAPVKSTKAETVKAKATARKRTAVSVKKVRKAA